MKLDSHVRAVLGKEFTILQLTDMQVIDAAQQRTPDRLRPDEIDAWKTEHVEMCTYTPIRAVIERTKPDLIIITGDIVYGEFDDSGRALGGFIAFMESFGIPWAPVFGNHDNEAKIGVYAQCRMLEKAPHCLFRRSTTLTGNSNYSVGIFDGAVLSRVLYMLDSNCCWGAADPEATRHHGMEDDQIAWMRDTADVLRAQNDRPIPGFACFHIPTEDYITAMVDAGYQTPDDEDGGNYIIDGTAPASMIDAETPSPNTCEEGNPARVLSPAHPGDTGYKNERMVRGRFQKPHSADFLAADVDGVFMGHCHKCQISVMGGDGIRYTHGVKSGTYDYHTRGRIGGTKITVSADRTTFAVEQVYV